MANEVQIVKSNVSGSYLTKEGICKSIPHNVVSRMIYGAIHCSCGRSKPCSCQIPREKVNEKYFTWIDGRARKFSDLAKLSDSTEIGSMAWIRSCIHCSVISSAGRCYFTGDLIAWEKVGTKKKRDEPDAPSIDHDRDMWGDLDYRITTIRTNRSKQDMTTSDWINLTERVKAHLGI